MDIFEGIITLVFVAGIVFGIGYLWGRENEKRKNRKKQTIHAAGSAGIPDEPENPRPKRPGKKTE